MASPGHAIDPPASFLIRREVAVGISRLESLKSADSARMEQVASVSDGLAAAREGTLTLDGRALNGKVVASYTSESWVAGRVFLKGGVGISIGNTKGERHGNMTYSPPSNKIQRFCGQVHERAVEVLVELLAMTEQSCFCLHTLLDSGAYPTLPAGGRTCSKSKRGSSRIYRIGQGGSAKP